jgi:hypothetical protein
MRKLKSREYCHNCGQSSEWEFEDREGNQILKCPLCGHLHYRVVNGGYIDFEIEFRGEKIDNINRINEILKEHPETKQELEQLLTIMEYGSLEDLKAFAVSDNRWGRDPSQGGWGVSQSTFAAYTNTYYYSTSTTTSIYYI